MWTCKQIQAVNVEVSCISSYYRYLNMLMNVWQLISIPKTIPSFHYLNKINHSYSFNPEYHKSQYP